MRPPLLHSTGNLIGEKMVTRSVSEGPRRSRYVPRSRVGFPEHQQQEHQQRAVKLWLAGITRIQIRFLHVRSPFFEPLIRHPCYAPLSMFQEFS
jgi:hypothetical protein